MKLLNWQILTVAIKVKLTAIFFKEFIFKKFFFRCEDGLKVLTLHQERPIKLPGCPDDTELCPLDKLVNLYHESLYNCTFTEMCQLDPV